MRERLISAAVLVPVVVIVFLLGDPWLTLGIALLAGVAAVEASRLVRGAGLAADSWFTASVTVLAVLGVRVMLDVPNAFGGFEASAPARHIVGGQMLTLMVLVVI